MVGNSNSCFSQFKRVKILDCHRPVLKAKQERSVGEELLTNLKFFIYTVTFAWSGRNNLSKDVLCLSKEQKCFSPNNMILPQLLARMQLLILFIITARDMPGLMLVRGHVGSGSVAFWTGMGGYVTNR